MYSQDKVMVRVSPWLKDEVKREAQTEDADLHIFLDLLLKRGLESLRQERSEKGVSRLSTEKSRSPRCSGARTSNKKPKRIDP